MVPTNHVVLHVLGLGFAAADAVQQGGFDLLGLAAVITSVSGLIGTVGALLIALKKKDANNDALAKALEQLAKKEEGEK